MYICVYMCVCLYVHVCMHVCEFTIPMLPIHHLAIYMGAFDTIMVFCQVMQLFFKK